MNIEIFSAEEYPQGSPEWRSLKCGIPSASNFKRVMAGGDGKVRSDYMRRLAGEIITGLPAEEHRNTYMDRGNAMEPELRDLYAMIADVEPVQVGFVKRTMPWGTVGASPDSMVGDDGCVEFKSEAPHLLIETMRDGRIPTEHLPQCQGTMLVTGRQWCDLVCGYSGMPIFRRRIKRDSSYIARLEVALEVFATDLQNMVKWIRSYRD